jgi:biopolymer transport protein ExbD
MAMGLSTPGVPEINVTPLIDILLVLLIICMIVNSMAHNKGLEASVPQPPTNATSPPIERTIVVQVLSSESGQPTLKINQEDVTWQALPDRLQAIFNTRAEKVAFVRADREIDFEYVADVIDIAHHAGVDRLGLLKGTGS